MFKLFYAASAILLTFLAFVGVSYFIHHTIGHLNEEFVFVVSVIAGIMIGNISAMASLTYYDDCYRAFIHWRMK